MKHENLVLKLERLVTQAEQLAEGKSVVEVEEDPRICALMIEAEPIVEELENILNGAFANYPEKLALWKKKMGMEE